MKGNCKNFNSTFSPKYIINNTCIVKKFLRLQGFKRFKLCFKKRKKYSILSFTCPCLVIENNEPFISTMNSRWTLLLNHSSIFLIKGPSSYPCFVIFFPSFMLHVYSGWSWSTQSSLKDPATLLISANLRISAFQTSAHFPQQAF